MCTFTKRLAKHDHVLYVCLSLDIRVLVLVGVLLLTKYKYNENELSWAYLFICTLVGVLLLSKWVQGTRRIVVVGHMCTYIYVCVLVGVYMLVCVCVGRCMYCTGSMYNQGNGLSWARARGHGCLPSVCLCYVHQVQEFV